jgi:hypothetical protein
MLSTTTILTSRTPEPRRNHRPLSPRTTDCFEPSDPHNHAKSYEKIHGFRFPSAKSLSINAALASNLRALVPPRRQYSSHNASSIPLHISAHLCLKTSTIGSVWSSSRDPQLIPLLSTERHSFRDDPLPHRLSPTCTHAYDRYHVQGFKCPPMRG